MVAMLVFRKATPEDAEDLYKWRFDVESLENSFQSKIVSFESHIKWFDAALNDDTKFIYIGIKNDMKVGVVRFEQDRNDYLVSLNVNPIMRGQGLGQTLLAQGCNLFLQEFPHSNLRAEIKPENKKSIAIFQKYGFVLKNKTSSKLTYKRNANSTG